jgi:DNA-directed RNA polymerase specialized sigma24 family protein
MRFQRFQRFQRCGFEDSKRNRWPDRARDEDAFEHLAAPDPQPRDDALLALLTSDAISPASRAVLARHFQEELSLPDVAAILELPLGTVKSRLSYGLSALRKHLNRERST